MRAFVVVAADVVVGVMVPVGGGERTEESSTRQARAEVARSDVDHDAEGSQQTDRDLHRPSAGEGQLRVTSASARPSTRAPSPKRSGAGPA